MPRVKALTTGSVPAFIDLILNFAESDTTSTLASQDTWLAQLRENFYSDKTKAGEQPGRLFFYGDDTWLKLFPSFFAESDGTTSFFVSVSPRLPHAVSAISPRNNTRTCIVDFIESVAEKYIFVLQDFTEVDNNVTRHIPTVLESSSAWDGVILHYLGLDHIGHKAGPKSPNMIPKQREMDGIVEQIFTAMEHRPSMQDTLLILAGDHGMNSAGNHGGSNAGETSPALLFASPKFQTLRGRQQYAAPAYPRDGTEFEYHRKVEQSDLVPTLAALMGVPVPRNNLGIVIKEFLGFWSSDDKLDHKGEYDDKIMQARAMLSLEDTALQILYRNALQILDIVKATFGEGSFSNIAGSNMQWSCRRTLEGRLELSCKWGLAQRKLLAASIDGRFSIEEQAEALTSVCSASVYT